jgi:hypothetical protein
MTIPRSRDLRLLAGAAGLSALGDFLAMIPLVLHVQERTGSTFAVSAVFFALWGPVVLGAGLAGTIVDRFENRALLLGVSLAQAAIAVALAFSVDTLWAVLALVALLGFGAELGALALGGLVVGMFGARTGLLVSGLGPAAIGLSCLLYLTTSRRHDAPASTPEGSTIHARVQG